MFVKRRTGEDKVSDMIPAMSHLNSSYRFLTDLKKEKQRGELDLSLPQFVVM